MLHASFGAAGLVDPLLERLRGHIRRHNRMSCPLPACSSAPQPISARHDGHGFVGDAVNQLFLLHVAPLKRTLADSGARLALIASDYPKGRPRNPPA
jgi:hypothetical protein